VKPGFYILYLNFTEYIPGLTAQKFEYFQFKALFSQALMEFIVRPKYTFLRQLFYSDYNYDEGYIQVYGTRTPSMNPTSSPSLMPTNQSSTHPTIVHRYLEENSDSSIASSSFYSSVGECLKYHVERNITILKIVYPIKVVLPLNVSYLEYSQSLNALLSNQDYIDYL